jgi:UPF0042 nucleotide-binding protein
MIHLCSFAFKLGQDGSLGNHQPYKGAVIKVIDCRQLPNPHNYSTIKHLDGRNKAIQSFVFHQPHKGVSAQDLIDDTVDWAIEAYKANPNADLVLAFGCVGGRHRSVAMAEQHAAQIGGWPHKIDHFGLRALGLE